MDQCKQLVTAIQAVFTNPESGIRGIRIPHFGITTNSLKYVLLVV